MSVARVYTDLAFDLSQLHDELVAGGVAPERVEGGPVATLVQVPDGQGGEQTVEVVVETLTLTLPDGVDTGAVDALVAAHIPRVRYDPATRLAEVGALLRESGRAALRAQVRRATTVDDLRAALLAHLQEEDGEMQG